MVNDMNPSLPHFLLMDTVSPEAVQHYFQLLLLSVGLVALLATIWWQADTARTGEITENRPVEAFDHLDIGGALNVLITSGEHPSLTIRGPAHAVAALRTRQYGNTLKIGQRFQFWHRTCRLFLTLTTPDLKRTEISGANLVQFKEFHNLSALELEITGASSVSFEGKLTTLLTEITGASRLTLTGQGQRLNAELTGASSLHAFDFAVEDADIELTGACNARLHVQKHLFAEAAGASTIQYRVLPGAGEPALRVRSAGASSVTRV